MAAKLKPVLEQTFDLTRTDELLENQGEPTKVTVKQATIGEHDRRMELWGEFTRSLSDDGGVEVKQNVSPAEVRRLEVMLTLRSCNLEDEDGSILFKFPVFKKLANITTTEIEAFNRAWSKLPPVIADEIHEKVLAVNPDWGGTEGEDD